MLKQRILTAIILIPLFLLLLFKLSSYGFAILTSIVVFLAAYEWSFLMGIKKFPFTLIYPLVVLFALFASLSLMILPLLLVTFAWWLLVAGLIISYPKTKSIWGNNILIRGLMGLLVLVPCWVALNLIRHGEHGIYTLLFLFVLIWGADSGAYFVGKKWGKNHLAPNVSPGKTFEGLYGALITSLFITSLVLWFLGLSLKMWICFLMLSILTVLFSIVGDLFESMLKRNENLKDSGHLLPGHGGILDRIDSLTAAAPVFVLGILLLAKIK